MGCALGLTPELGKQPCRSGGDWSAQRFLAGRTVRHASRGRLGISVIMPFSASFVISPVHQRDLVRGNSTESCRWNPGWTRGVAGQEARLWKVRELAGSRCKRDHMKELFSQKRGVDALTTPLSCSPTGCICSTQDVWMRSTAVLWWCSNQKGSAGIFSWLETLPETTEWAFAQDRCSPKKIKPMMPTFGTELKSWASFKSLSEVL